MSILLQVVHLVGPDVVEGDVGGTAAFGSVIPDVVLHVVRMEALAFVGVESVPVDEVQLVQTVRYVRVVYARVGTEFRVVLEFIR